MDKARKEKLISNIKINIRKYRTKRGYSKREFSRKFNIPYYTIIALEVRQYKDVNITTLINFAEALEVKLQDLLGEF